MNKMLKRFVLWFGGIAVSFAGGLYLDRRFEILLFPLWMKVLAIIFTLFSIFLLARSGRLLRNMGKPEEWGWTTRLVTSDLYKCLRHPHHLGIGMFVSAFSIIIGGFFTFILASLFIWVGIIWFLRRVEEPELVEKFGEEYLVYRENTPMLIPSPLCLFKTIFKGVGKKN